jgi:hypothetical protein
MEGNRLWQVPLLLSDPQHLYKHPSPVCWRVSGPFTEDLEHREAPYIPVRKTNELMLFKHFEDQSLRSEAMART